MIFAGFMEGSKAVGYWDKEWRSIKVSRNFAFSKNKELKELQVSEIPSLDTEGENSGISASQTTPDTTKNTQETSTKFIHDNPKQSDEQNSQNICTQTNKIDYRQMNDPLHKLITWKQLNQDNPKIDESPEERANLAIKQIILEKEFGFLWKKIAQKLQKKHLIWKRGSTGERLWKRKWIL